MTRRLHLYSGVLLFPWALLYGVTALLFNHPLLLTRHATLHLQQEDFVGTPLEKGNDPWEDAQAIIAAVNQKRSESEPSSGKVVLNQDVAPTYLTGTLSLRARGPGKNYVSYYDVHSNSASVLLSETDDEVQAAPFEMRGLRIPNSLGDRIRNTLPIALQEKGVEVDTIVLATGSTLRFQVQVDDKDWVADYQIQTGTLTGRESSKSPLVDTRQFLLGLHRSHSYSAGSFVQSLWAFWVDVMSLSLVFWGISGLFMWWQLKQQRRIGLAISAGGIILFALTVGAIYFAK